VLDDTVVILLVEDNPGDARLFRETLNEAKALHFELAHCESFRKALDYLTIAEPQVIVLDLGLPDAFGIEVVRRARAAAPSVPIVVLTSRDDEAVGMQALHEGAQDYLTKGEIDARLLSRALRYAIERHRMQEALRNESLVDVLTGLYNRRGFLTLAGNHVKLTERTRSPFALVFVDLDGMKQINDSLGHAEGDRALIETAGLLKGCMRQTDILARLGGDEFVLLLAAAGEHTEEVIRKRLQEQLDVLNAEPGRLYTLSLSVGIVIASPQHPLTLEELLVQADALMYQHKQVRKNRA